jgi:hypothetical protein
VEEGDYTHCRYKNSDWKPVRNELIRTASGMLIMSWINQDDLAFLRQKKLIQAIKNLRIHSGLGLAQAKWAIEFEWIYLVSNGLEGPNLKNYHDDQDDYIPKTSKSRHDEVIMIEDRFYKLQEVSRNNRD